MIVVKVELHSAITGAVTPLGTAIIANDGSGTHARGRYDAWFGRKGQDLVNLLSCRGDARHSRVEGFPRLSKNAWHLLARALKAAGYVS